MRASDNNAKLLRRKESKLAHSKKYVLNLSKYSLRNEEYLLLAKGLKFIPTPMHTNKKRSLLRDFDEFSRKLRCKYLFDDGSNEH